MRRLRVSVRIIVEMSRQVADFQQLCEALPQCTPEELRAALDYYEDHKALIEADIERNRQAWEKVVTGLVGAGSEERATLSWKGAAS